MCCCTSFYQISVLGSYFFQSNVMEIWVKNHQIFQLQIKEEGIPMSRLSSLACIFSVYM